MNDIALKSNDTTPISVILKQLAINPLFWMGIAASYMAGQASFSIFPLLLAVLTFVLEIASPADVHRTSKFFISYFILTVVANYSAYQSHQLFTPFTG